MQASFTGADLTKQTAISGGHRLASTNVFCRIFAAGSAWMKNLALLTCATIAGGRFLSCAGPGWRSAKQRAWTKALSLTYSDTPAQPGSCRPAFRLGRSRVSLACLKIWFEKHTATTPQISKRQRRRPVTETPPIHGQNRCFR